MTFVEFCDKIRTYVNFENDSWYRRPEVELSEHDVHCAAYSEGLECCLTKPHVLAFLWRLAQDSNAGQPVDKESCGVVTVQITKI